MLKLLSPLFLLVSLNSYAGWQMLFCDSTDQQGNCIGKSETFILSGATVPLKVVLSNTEGIKTTKIYFEIYLVDPATFAEDLVATEELKTEVNATVAFQALSLNRKGNYLITARDSYKDYLTSRELTVK